MLVLRKATASSRPNLHLLEISALFNFASGSALIVLVVCKKMICDENEYDFWTFISGLAELESDRWL